MQQFAKRVNGPTHSSADLHRYSIAEMANFWDNFIDFSGLIYEGSWEQVIEKGSSMAETRFLMA